MTNSPEQRTLADAAFETAAKQQRVDTAPARAARRVAAQKAEARRLSRNRRRAGLVVGATAVTIAVGVNVADDVKDAFTAVVPGLSSEFKRDKNCIVINEPLGNRVLWDVAKDVAKENSEKLGLDVKNDGQMTRLTNVIQDNGGEGSLPLAEATGMSATQQIQVEVCVTDPAAIPVHIFSPEGTSK